VQRVLIGIWMSLRNWTEIIHKPVADFYKTRSSKINKTKIYHERNWIGFFVPFYHIFYD
jgi:hypothetical protein